MKKEDLKAATTYHSSYARKLREKETLLERFTYWFRDFLDNAE